MKGVAGNIGIMEVHSAAQRLEKAIREGHDSVPTLLDEFRALLSTQVEAIRQALPESPRAIEQEVRRLRLQWRDGLRRDQPAPDIA